ncbi:hypothetical protein [Streptomyces sp. NPDC051014]|uniref:hypothetical protein n=1 Tax=Streptomyces sp. NPDC051014 TaxID=3155751 RepID=UPI0033CAC98B
MPGSPPRPATSAPLTWPSYAERFEDLARDADGIGADQEWYATLLTDLQALPLCGLSP